MGPLAGLALMTLVKRNGKRMGPWTYFGRKKKGSAALASILLKNRRRPREQHPRVRVDLAWRSWGDRSEKKEKRGPPNGSTKGKGIRHQDFLRAGARSRRGATPYNAPIADSKETKDSAGRKRRRG